MTPWDDPHDIFFDDVSDVFDVNHVRGKGG